MRMAFVLVLTGAGSRGDRGVRRRAARRGRCGSATPVSSRREGGPPRPATPDDRGVAHRPWPTSTTAPRRRTSPTAFGCLAFLALLQNLDVILLGREAPKHSGEYAAISVAAKALVFGAIALGGYLLPEATIRWHRGEHALRQLATTAVDPRGARRSGCSPRRSSRRSCSSGSPSVSAW